MSCAVDAPTRRERRRAATVREILDAAERLLAERGPHGVALRAVAREVGMTVQSLYHYFDSRDALLTALVEAAQDDLADAVEAACAAHPPAASRARLLAAGQAYRAWAIAHPGRFQLAYGPLPGAGSSGESGPELRLAAVLRVLVAGHRFPGAAGMSHLTLWSRLHGLVALEVSGHVRRLCDPAALFTAAMQQLADDLDRCDAPAAGGRVLT